MTEHSEDTREDEQTTSGRAAGSEEPPGRRRALGITAAAAALLLVAGVVTWNALRPPEAVPPVSSPPAAALPDDYPFGPDSVWREDITDAPLADNSDEQVAYVAQQVASRYEGVAAFNVNQFTAAYYTVESDQPTVDVAWDDCQDIGYAPRGLLGDGGQFTAVPIPDEATPAVGSDGQLTIYSPSTDQLWEFWKAARTDDGGWRACWGGRIDDVSSAPGFFSGMFGASASGLAISGGMVWVEDARAGEINHALSLQLTEAAHWKQVSWPAQRSDGFSRDSNAVMEGTRLRLDPRVDVESLNLTPLGAMVARAAQTYGFIVTDRAGSVALTAESGQEVPGEANPWPELMSGEDSWSVLAGFPWEDLQALPKDYGKPSGGSAPAVPEPSGSSS